MLPERAARPRTSRYLPHGSRQQRRPRRVRGVARRRDPLFVAAGDVDRVKRRPRIAAGVAEEHQHAAVRRPGRALVVIALGEDPLVAAVYAHDADGEAALVLLGERDRVAARRPHRRGVGTFAEADALRPAAVGGHDVDLRAPAAIGFEADAVALGRIAWG